MTNPDHEDVVQIVRLLIRIAARSPEERNELAAVISHGLCAELGLDHAAVGKDALAQDRRMVQ